MMCRMFLTVLLISLTSSEAALQSSSRNLQPLVDDVQAAGVTECGSQVERPVVSCARSGEVVLEAHLAGHPRRRWRTVSGTPYLSQFPEPWRPQSFSFLLSRQCPSRSRLAATSFLRLGTASLQARLAVGSRALWWA